MLLTVMFHDVILFFVSLLNHSTYKSMLGGSRVLAPVTFDSFTLASFFNVFISKVKSHYIFPTVVETTHETEIETGFSAN